MRTAIKRAYEAPARSDGRRILVDRLWPRGLTKDAAKIEFWAKEVAPSNALRRWYGHEPERWREFQRRYFAELDGNPEAVAELRERMGKGHVTFVFSSKEERLNNAVALAAYLKKVRRGSRDRAGRSAPKARGSPQAAAKTRAVRPPNAAARSEAKPSGAQS